METDGSRSNAERVRSSGDNSISVTAAATAAQDGGPVRVLRGLDGSRCTNYGVAADLAAELAVMPNVVENLLARHVSDGSGRCRGCTSPGTGLPQEPWPCALHFYATAAVDTRVDDGRPAS